MMGHAAKIRICRGLIVLNLCFIWGNSLLPAEVSQSLSDGTQNFLDVFHFGSSGSLFYSVVVRKAAHFMEFAALGLLLSWLFALTEKNRRAVLPLGLAVACVDEAIQFFVPGRAPGLLDVAIDVCGVITGMFLLQTGYFILKRKRPTTIGGKQE